MPTSDLGKVDIMAVLDTSVSPGLSQPEQVAALEASLCAFSGSRYAIAVGSSKVALQLCLHAAGIGPGDLVITTPYSPPFTIEALLSAKAVPVFVDVEPRTGNIDPHLVFASVQDIMQGGKNAQAWLPPAGASVDSKLKAILPVDISGQPCNLELILNTAWKYRLKVIEEASEALGASYQGRAAGTLGDFGTYSFKFSYQGSSWEAGAIITDDPEAASEMVLLRDHATQPGQDLAGKSASAIDYYPEALSAALSAVYLPRLEQLMGMRSQVAEWYRQRLVEIAGIETPAIARYASTVSWPVYVVRLTSGSDRQAIVRKLASLGISSRPYHFPLHLRSEIM